MEEGIKMISAVAEVYAYRRRNPNVEKEDILQHIANFISNERNKQAKIGMIVAASKAAELIEKNPYLSEKDAIRTIMAEIPNILMQIAEEKENQN